VLRLFNLTENTFLQWKKVKIRTKQDQSNQNVRKKFQKDLFAVEPGMPDAGISIHNLWGPLLPHPLLITYECYLVETKLSNIDFI